MSNSLVVAPRSDGKIELRLIEGGERIGRVVLSPAQVRDLIARLRLAAARAAVGRHVG